MEVLKGLHAVLFVCLFFSYLYAGPTVSSEVFRSLSEYEFATFYFDEKTCETAM